MGIAKGGGLWSGMIMLQSCLRLGFGFGCSKFPNSKLHGIFALPLVLPIKKKVNLSLNLSKLAQ